MKQHQKGYSREQYIAERKRLAYKDETLKTGDKIRLLRKVYGYTQTQLANKIGSNISTVCSWERREHEPRIEMIEKIAELFDVSPLWLADLNEH